MQNPFSSGHASERVSMLLPMEDSVPYTQGLPCSSSLSACGSRAKWKRTLKCMVLEVENMKCKYTETKLRRVGVTRTINFVEEWKVHDCRAWLVSSEDIAIRRVVLIHFLILYLGKGDTILPAVSSRFLDSLRHREIIYIVELVCLFLSSWNTSILPPVVTLVATKERWLVSWTIRSCNI